MPEEAQKTTLSEVEFSLSLSHFLVLSFSLPPSLYLSPCLSVPAGMPEEAKETTSSDVKSGRVNVSFSKSSDHGSILMKSVACVCVCV